MEEKTQEIVEEGAKEVVQEKREELSAEELKTAEKKREAELKQNKVRIIVCAAVAGVCALICGLAVWLGILAWIILAVMGFAVCIIMTIAFAAGRGKIKNQSPKALVEKSKENAEKSGPDADEIEAKHLACVEKIPHNSCFTFKSYAYYSGLTVKGTTRIFSITDKGIIGDEGTFYPYEQCTAIETVNNMMYRYIKFKYSDMDLAFTFDKKDFDMLQKLVKFANTKIEESMKEELKTALQTSDEGYLELEIGEQIISSKGKEMTYSNAAKKMAQNPDNAMTLITIKLAVCEESKRFAVLHNGRIAQCASFLDIDRMYVIEETTQRTTGQSREGLLNRAFIGTSNHTYSNTTVVEKSFVFNIVLPTESIKLSIDDPETFMNLRIYFERHTGKTVEKI